METSQPSCPLIVMGSMCSATNATINGDDAVAVDTVKLAPPSGSAAVYWVLCSNGRTSLKVPTCTNPSTGSKPIPAAVRVTACSSSVIVCSSTALVSATHLSPRCWIAIAGPEVLTNTVPEGVSTSVHASAEGRPGRSNGSVMPTMSANPSPSGRPTTIA